MEISLPSPLRLRLNGAYDRLVDQDFTKARAISELALVFLLLRLPFLHYGHGTDPDAWRVAITAHHLLDTGDYFPSRLPGNPLHELLMTVFIPGGWVATNLATALFSLLGVYLFALIVRELRLPNAGLLVIGFAFTPLLIINSMATMDYMWTLTLLLGSYYALLTGRPVLSGLVLGAAIGFRLQSFVFLLPLAYMLWRQRRRNEIAPLTLAAAGVAILAFAPVLVVYGLDFFNYYDAKVGLSDVIRLLGKEALGVVGALGVLLGAALSLSRLRAFLPDLVSEVQTGVWAIAIFIYFISFSNLPHEIAYLIPVFPFGFFIMGRYFSRLALATTVGAILLAGVIDVTTPTDDLTLDSLKTATIGKGLVLSNEETMTAQRKLVEQIRDNELPNHSVVLTGFIFPQLAVRERDDLKARIVHRDYGAISMLTDRGEAVDTLRDIRYVWLLNHDTFEALRSQGYAFYQVPDAAAATAALYDYRPRLFGSSFLTLERDEAASVSEGQAGTDR